MPGVELNHTCSAAAMILFQPRQRGGVGAGYYSVEANGGKGAHDERGSASL